MSGGQAREWLAQAKSVCWLMMCGRWRLRAGYQRQPAQQLRGAERTISPSRRLFPFRCKRRFASMSAASLFAARWKPPGLRYKTVGFAGFFGLPVVYTPLGTAARRPQLLDLLAPALEVYDTGPNADALARSAGIGLPGVRPGKQPVVGLLRPFPLWNQLGGLLGKSRAVACARHRRTPAL